ncbi:IS3 family transposase [Streptomyces sp. MA15]|uniref:IS3 family transposase n=1 Tax=Streptomyces sp. MA15 TaxID=3055061 RepID=UPI0025B10D9E|nr:IS3 family transposase [Streptomyces sp. MA15]MDN3267098.1 IS3 family transposase [Streptomyces sp. MA15]
MTAVYAFIEEERTTHTVALPCRLLKVARSSFQAWRSGEQARRARQAAGDAPAHEITVLHIASRHTCGVPRIHADLRGLGRRGNRWGPRLRGRGERVMRERGVTGVTRRRRRNLTCPAKRAVPAVGLPGRDFTAPEPGTRPAGDITSIATDEGRLCLAAWLDLATREIVGCSTAGHHRAGLAVDAPATAAGRGGLRPGCIAHSDRGSEYTSEELRGGIRRWGLRQSTGRTGSCFDDAAESFFAVLKEETGTRRRPGRTTARAGTFAFIETSCNRRRLRKHPHWGHLPPLEIRQRHEQGHALAA